MDQHNNEAERTIALHVQTLSLSSMAWLVEIELTLLSSLDHPQSIDCCKQSLALVNDQIVVKHSCGAVAGRN